MRPRLPEPSWVSVAGVPRYTERLDLLAQPPRGGPAVLADIAGAGACMLTGGEPTLRPDLPALLSAGAVGIRTDGLLLASPAALASLQRAGLSRVRIRIHSSRADAHDWLSGAPGSLKRALRGLRACVRAGVVAEIEIVLTRPTLSHLSETVALVCRLGARGVALRRLTAQGNAAADFVALSPRLGLLRAPIEAAMAAAGGVPVWTEGVPACMAPRDSLRSMPVQRAAGCADCPESCPGYPEDYAQRFGLAELWRVSPRPARERIRVVISPREATRDVRRRLVTAAMCQPTVLRVVGAAEHPARAALLRELLRLSVPRVELAGLQHGLAALSGADLLRLRGFSRIDAALLGADEATHDEAVGQPGAWRAVQELRGVGRYGIVGSAEEARRHIAGGVSEFRLASAGGSLASLADLPPLASLIPPCLGGSGGAPPVAETFHGSTPEEHTGSPTDRLGATRPCPHADQCAAASKCPGLAAGWDAAGVHPLRSAQ